MSVECHLPADEIDQPAGEIDDLPANRDHVARSIIDGVHHRAQPLRLRYGVVVEEDDIPCRRANERRADASCKSVILAEGKKSDVRIAFGNRADAAILRPVVDNGDHRVVDILQLCSDGVQTGQGLISSVPVDDDDVDRRRRQDTPPMRRFNRVRIDGGRSGTCMRTANASFVASTRGCRQNSSSGARARGHW